MNVRDVKAEAIIASLKQGSLLLDYQLSEPGLSIPEHSTDTRRAGNDKLLICYRGVRFDAHQQVESLSAQFPGMLLIVEDQQIYQKIKDKLRFVALVKDGREAWSYLAALRHGQPQQQLKMIGVTGTNGKTSTVWFVRQLLKAQGIPCITLGTLGIFLGDEVWEATHTTPDPDELFRALRVAADKGISWGAMEVSSHAIQQRRLGPLRFDAVAFTSFSRDHLDYHASMEEYFACKWELLTRYRKPGAQAFLSSALGKKLPPLPDDVQFYGAETPDFKIPQAFRFRIGSMELNRTDMTLEQGTRRWQTNLPFGGQFALDNLTAAFALVDSLKAQTRFEGSALQPVPGRFEPVPEAAKVGLAVIVDYAHTPDALEKTLLKLKEMSKGELWVVFGCGGDRDKGKRPLMGAIAERCADRVVVTSDNPRTEEAESILDDIVAGMQHPEKILRQVDRKLAIEMALSLAKKGDTIAIAGKGHEDYQIIGTEKFAFDDRLVAAAFLQNKLSH